MTELTDILNNVRKDIDFMYTQINKMDVNQKLKAYVHMQEYVQAIDHLIDGLIGYQYEIMLAMKALK